jgi:hypothetical protein
VNGPVGKVELVVPSSDTAAFAVTQVGAGIAATLILGVAVWVLLHMQPVSLEESAFRKLARGIGLTRAERAYVRREAGRRGAPPVALLVCPRTLRDGAAVPALAASVVRKAEG